MNSTRKEPVAHLYAHLLALNIREYLESDRFSLFLKNHGLEDAWKQFLAESQDMPDLYGEGVGENAFTLFLSHVFHSRNEEFPTIMRDFFSSIATWSSHLLPVGELRQDLHNLGYSYDEMSAIF
jgi:hypothetical protein